LNDEVHMTTWTTWQIVQKPWKEIKHTTSILLIIAIVGKINFKGYQNLNYYL
jgi:hypothetical protein